MPVSNFQKLILQLIAKNRNPDSYLAGGTAINRAASSLRYSKDIDLFHDLDEAVQAASVADISLLRQSGYSVRIILQQPAFVRGLVSRGADSIKLEWVQDSAFRFFPVVEDSEFGYCLHDIDLATNKCLALANRSEVRDIIDLTQLHERVLSLPAIVWASCGKDPGFTPQLLLEQLARNSKFSPVQLEAEQLRQALDPISLKKEWISLLTYAREHIEKFPAQHLGCIYVRTDASVVQAPENADLASLKPHRGTVRGAWPRAV